MAYTMDLYMVVTHLLTGMILTKWVAGLLSDLSGWKARSDALLSPKKKVENNPDSLTPKEETWKNHPGFYCLEFILGCTSNFCSDQPKADIFEN